MRTVAIAKSSLWSRSRAGLRDYHWQRPKRGLPSQNMARKRVRSQTLPRSIPPTPRRPRLCGASSRALPSAPTPTSIGVHPLNGPNPKPDSATPLASRNQTEVVPGCRSTAAAFCYRSPCPGADPSYPANGPNRRTSFVDGVRAQHVHRCRTACFGPQQASAIIRPHAHIHRSPAAEGAGDEAGLLTTPLADKNQTETCPSPCVHSSRVRPSGVAAIARGIHPE